MRKISLMLVLLTAMLTSLVGYAQGAASQYHVYRYDYGAIVDGNGTMVYTPQEIVDLRDYNEGGIYQSAGYVGIPVADFYIAVGTEAPNLYTTLVKDDEGNIVSYETDYTKPVEVTTVSADNLASTTLVQGKLYKITGNQVTKGVYEYNPTTGKLNFAPALYLCYLKHSAVKGAFPVHYEWITDSSVEIPYENGQYRLDDVAIEDNTSLATTTSSVTGFTIKTLLNKDVLFQKDGDNGYKATEIAIGENVTVSSNVSYNPASDFYGYITVAPQGGDSYVIKLNNREVSDNVYLYILDKGDSRTVKERYQFEAERDNDMNIQAYWVDNARIADGVPFVITSKNMQVGKKIGGTPTSTWYGKSDLSTTENEQLKDYLYSARSGLTTNYKSIAFNEGTDFYGKVKIDYATMSTTADSYKVAFYTVNNGRDIITSYTGLVDEKITDYPLMKDDKPLFHENDDFKQYNKYTIGGVEHDLVYMTEGRRALTGPGTHINCLSGGALANVISVNTSLDNIIGHELGTTGDFTNIANVKLTTAPLVSVKDQHHYYAAGTEAGFNIVAADGTSVLSLSVIETLSIAFYRDGNLIAVSPVKADSGSGIGLGLITVSSETSSYDMTAVAPCIFDEVAIWTADGLKLDVGGNFKVNYAFVGKEKELYLSQDWITEYNAANGTKLKVTGTSTTYDSAGLLNYNFGHNLNGTENLANVLNILTLGEAWAKVYMVDEANPGKEVFHKGDRVNFVLSGGSLLKLGVGSTNVIEFYDVNKNKVDTKHLSTTVLDLQVVEISGNQVLSMVAPCDFSGAGIVFSEGLLNLGGKNICYASVTPAPYQEHLCDLKMPTTIYLTQQTEHYIYYDEDGDVIAHKQYVTRPDSFNPHWDESTGVELEWQIVEAPAGSTATIDKSTGEIKGLMQNSKYVLAWQVVGAGHEQCFGEVTVITRDKMTYADDAELASVIGHSVLLTDDEWKLSTVPHGSEFSIAIGESRVKYPDAVLDNSLYTAAIIPVTLLNLIDNSCIAGVKLKDPNATVGGKGKQVRVGFIIEAPNTFLGGNVLDFFNIRVYDKNGNKLNKNTNEVPKMEQGVDVGLIGEKKVSKARMTVLLDADVAPFCEIQLWRSGVLNLGLEQLKIYGVVLDENPEQEAETYLWLPENSEVVGHELRGQAYPIGGTGVKVGSTMKDISNVVDGDLTTCFAVGNGVGVGDVYKIRVHLGRTITTTEKVRLIFNKTLGLADAQVGDWLKVTTYRSSNLITSEIGNVGNLDDIEVVPGTNDWNTATPSSVMHRVGAQKTEGAAIETALGTLVPTGDELQNWAVADVKVANVSDLESIYFKSSKDFDVMEIELGNAVVALTDLQFHGIVASAATDETVKFHEFYPGGEFNLELEATQLLRLTDEGKKALKAAGYANCNDDFITYMNENLGNVAFHTANNVGGMNAAVHNIDEALARQIIRNPENVQWTANYLLRAVEPAQENSEATLFETINQPNGGMKLSMGTVGKLYAIDMEQNLNEGELRYTGFYDADGVLDTKQFIMQPIAWYPYKNETGVVMTDEITGQPKLRSPKINVNVVEATPKVPAAYGITYFYDSERCDQDTFADNTTLISQSSVVDKDGNLMVKPLITDYPADADSRKLYVPDFTLFEQKEKTVDVSGLNHHHLNCYYKFYRPNVDQDILDRYHVFMQLGLDNNVTSETSEYYMDPRYAWMTDAAAEYNNHPYIVKVNKVNPLTDVSPVLSVRKTMFVANSEAQNLKTDADLDNWYDLAKNNVVNQVIPAKAEGEEGETPSEQPAVETVDAFVGDYYAWDYSGATPVPWYHQVAADNAWVMSLQANNKPERLPLYIDNMEFNMIDDPYTGNGQYLWEYTGSMNYTEKGDYVHDGNGDDVDENLEVTTHLSPWYYDVEAFTYNDATGDFKYHDYGKIFVANDTNIGDRTGNPDNAGILAAFAKEETFADNMPTFVITPVYIYRREVEAEPLLDAQLPELPMNDLKRVETPADEPNKVIRRAEEAETETDPNTVDGVQYVVKRGAAGIYKLDASNYTPILTGVENLDAAESDIKAVYDMQGRKLNALPDNGIYIVVLQNGKTMKVVR